MKYNKLGSSDLKVSIVCLGTMTWGEQNTEEEAFEQMDYALAHGINFVDTAEVYPVPISSVCGETEEIIGRYFAARPGTRDKVILATKVCGNTGNNPNGRFCAANRTVPKNPNAEPPVLSGKQIRAAVDGSLRRLRTSYIDLIQLHWPDRYVPVFGANQYRLENESPGVPFDEQVEAVGALIKEGKVREWGISNETPWGVAKMAETAARLGIKPPISIQNDFSLLDRRFEGHLAEACAPSNANLGLMVYGGLAGGTLTDKYHDGLAPPEGSRHVRFPNFQPRYHSDRSVAAAAKYAALAKSKGLTTTQLALAWIKSRWFVASVIIGATTMEQLRENIAALEEVELDAATLAEIDAIHLQARNPNATD